MYVPGTVLCNLHASSHLTPLWCVLFHNLLLMPLPFYNSLSFYIIIIPYHSILILPWRQLAHTHPHPQPGTLCDVRKLAPHGGFSACSWTFWPRTTFPSGVQGLWPFLQYPRPIPGPSSSSLPVVYFSTLPRQALKEQCKDKQDPGHLHFEHSPNPAPLLISNFPCPKP